MSELAVLPAVLQSDLASGHQMRLPKDDADSAKRMVALGCTAMLCLALLQGKASVTEGLSFRDSVGEEYVSASKNAC